MMRERFDALCTEVFGALKSGEDATLYISAESSDFVRFNRGKVRQAGNVLQGKVDLRLIRGQRHASAQFELGTHDDSGMAATVLRDLRELLDIVPDDPHLMWCEDGASSERVASDAPAEAEPIVRAILDAGDGIDLVGILATGEMASGFASSRGQRNWDQRHGWLFDWCVYDQGDKAVKTSLGGSAFDAALLERRIAEASRKLAILRRPVRKLSPGDYRVYLTPSAVGELVGLACRDGFSLRAHRSHSSCLGHLAREERLLSPMLQLEEDVGGGLAPSFTSAGFARPNSVPLVASGKLAGQLISPRSSREYGGTPNAGWESPNSLSMAGGTLSPDAILETLGTGLYVSNLWYLNFSDHQSARVTGMTRFATVWVEDGVAVAPTEVMRFDDTIYALLGDKLEALTETVDMLPSASTYGMRSASSQRVPGALIEGMTFTL